METNESSIMKRQLAKLSLQGVVYAAVTGAVESLSILLFPKCRKSVSRVGTYIVSEIISGAIGEVISDDVDAIMEETK